jgi:hypothetical protein
MEERLRSPRLMPLWLSTHRHTARMARPGFMPRVLAALVTPVSIHQGCAAYYGRASCGSLIFQSQVPRRADTPSFIRGGTSGIEALCVGQLNGGAFYLRVVA